MRSKGQVAKSQELNTALLFVVAVVFLRFYFQRIVLYVETLTSHLWTTLPLEVNPAYLMEIFTLLLGGMLMVLAPFFFALIVTAVIANIYQVGWILSFQPLQPDITRFNPIAGFKKFFSWQPFIQLFQNMIKIIIFVWISYSILSYHYPTLLQTVNMDIVETGAVIGAITWEICWKLGLVMLILAIADFAWQRYYFERSIRMSKQEVKDEHKNSEGDPLIKSKIRQLQRKAAMRRMMEAIPKADVVLTNPVHLAVVIEYKQEIMGAPQVTAKGAGQVAERIKELAREHRIPILENKPLARSLFRAVEIGEEVPSEFYAAVSEVLVYVYQLTGKIKKPDGASVRDEMDG